MSSGDAVAEPGISDTIMTPLDNTNRTNIGENSEPKASVQNVGSNSCVKSTENMLNVNSGESSEIRTSDCLNELEIKNKGNATTVNFTKGEESECNGDKLNNDGNNIKNNNSIMNDCNLRTITKEELLALPEKELWEKWQFLIKKLEVLDTQLQSQINTPDGDLQETNERLKSQISELQRKEAYHIMRLTTKEQELQDMAASVAATKSFSVSRNSLLDPAVNLCIERMKKDLEAARTKMEEAQNELAAWKFTPDRCAKLYNDIFLNIAY